jgi:hypothetical protein
MHQAGVPLKRAQEILFGHASERTTLAIYTHSMQGTHDHSADKIAILAGRSDKCSVPSVTSSERRSSGVRCVGASGILKTICLR